MSDFNKWLQMRLASHGFATGLIDGEIGPVTLQAIKAFEAHYGLPVNGTADGDVIKALRAPVVATPLQMSQIPDRDAPVPIEVKISGATKPVWPRQNAMTDFYGEKGTNQVSVAIPFDVRLAWDKGIQLRKMTLHKKVAESATRAFEAIARAYDNEERSALGIDMFGGSLNVRKMRGGSAWSIHSWGCAIDFDPERNGLHVHAPKARFSQPDARPFWEAWEAEGWVSLGRARDFDWMHVQAARL